MHGPPREGEEKRRSDCAEQWERWLLGLDQKGWDYAEDKKENTRPGEKTVSSGKKKGAQGDLLTETKITISLHRGAKAIGKGKRLRLYGKGGSGARKLRKEEDVGGRPGKVSFWCAQQMEEGEVKEALHHKKGYTRNKFTQDGIEPEESKGQGECFF